MEQQKETMVEASIDMEALQEALPFAKPTPPKALEGEERNKLIREIENLQETIAESHVIDEQHIKKLQGAIKEGRYIVNTDQLARNIMQLEEALVKATS